MSRLLRLRLLFVVSVLMVLLTLLPSLVAQDTTTEASPQVNPDITEVSFVFNNVPAEASGLNTWIGVVTTPNPDIHHQVFYTPKLTSGPVPPQMQNIVIAAPIYEGEYFVDFVITDQTDGGFDNIGTCTISTVPWSSNQEATFTTPVQKYRTGQRVRFTYILDVSNSK